MITKGTSFYIQEPTREALLRQELSQVGLSELTGTKKTTLNRYLTDAPTPIGTIAQIAAVLDDGTYNQQMASLVFKVMPVMQSDTFSDDPHVLDFLAEIEGGHRADRQKEALFILSKRDDKITKEDQIKLTQFVSEFLDEILIETKLVLSIIDKTGFSFSEIIANRIRFWISEGYLTERKAGY